MAILYAVFALQFFDYLFGSDWVPEPVAWLFSGQPGIVSVSARPMIGPTKFSTFGVCVKTNLDHDFCRRNAVDSAVWLMAEVTITTKDELDDRVTVKCDVTSDRRAVKENFRYTFQAEHHGNGALEPGVEYTHVIGVTNYANAVRRFTDLHPPKGISKYQIRPSTGQVECVVTQAW